MAAEGYGSANAQELDGEIFEGEWSNLKVLAYV